MGDEMTHMSAGDVAIEDQPDRPCWSSHARLPVPHRTVIGQAESALGPLVEPLLARTATTFGQWLVLTVTAASGASIDRGQLVARISHARKVDDATVEAAIAELVAAGLVTADGPVTLTDAGQARYHSVRAALEEITTPLFDFPAEDLATAGRVLSTVTTRANAVLAGQG
jgi:DNA-binding MarR family transcriptional regulator